jgi:hypothetical protein
VEELSYEITVSNNWQSHQNKFHAATIRFLTQKFANISPGDWVSHEDKELWEYFASLYKNSNKGIKGRGKDRRISAVSPSTAAHSSYSAIPMASMHRSFSGSYQHDSSNRSSRSSSISTDTSHRRTENNFDFNTTMHNDYQTLAPGYHDMVFPERKMY